MTVAVDFTEKWRGWGLDHGQPQMDERVRKEAPHSEVKKSAYFSRQHRTPSCLWPVGGSAEDVCARIWIFAWSMAAVPRQVFPIHVGAEVVCAGHSSHCRPLKSPDNVLVGWAFFQEIQLATVVDARERRASANWDARPRSWLVHLVRFITLI